MNPAFTVFSGVTENKVLHKASCGKNLEWRVKGRRILYLRVFRSGKKG